MGIRFFSFVNRGWLQRLWLSGCTTYLILPAAATFVGWLDATNDMFRPPEFTSTCASTAFLSSTLSLHCLRYNQNQDFSWIWFLSLPKNGSTPILIHPHHLGASDFSNGHSSKDIFFSPTVTGTLDLVFIESQAAGVAVVGPRAVAVPLVVTDGVNGRRRGGRMGRLEVWKSSRMASFLVHIWTTSFWQDGCWDIVARVWMFFGKIGVRHVFVGRLEELMYYDEIREVWLARFRLFHYWKVVSYIYIYLFKYTHTRMYSVSLSSFSTFFEFWRGFDKSAVEHRTHSGQWN